jgi:hypothetical protein
MNANELALYMEDITDYEESPYRQAATMLRQQQTEIEALKQIIDANNLSQNIGQFVKPANEPVAWRNLCVSNIGEDSEWIYNEIGQGKPLYTHPAKTLTDEEIKQVMSKFYSYNPRLLEFARAILKKAQEK